MNRITTVINRRTGLAPLVVSFLLSVPAWAQKADEKLPPFDVQGLEHKRVWVPWVFASLFVLLTVAIAFKNPRRSHQD